MALSLSPAAAAPADPSAWPAAPGRDPELVGTADSVRYAGPDRYQTNTALNLALRGDGGYPFTTADRTGGWWGAASCPRAILVVAGDTFADALAAASLSDPTDRSDQPRLRRVAASDPAFNPPGGFDRVDTAFAPIVVTESSRAGATALATSARFTARDLASRGCATAREAIVVGGAGAVPPAVDAELVTLGYREVFRVAGLDRYDTAAQIAEALGTGTPTGSECADVDPTDGRVALGWHGNAVVEFRPSAETCRVLARSVVLADGDTGADALAAGWWTSRWQVPVLLTAPDGSLPPATRRALSDLPIDTLIVLGGTARIPESTVDEARLLSTSTAGRVAGADRYETSLSMAHAFGGWWPTGDGADFAYDNLCIASSSGGGAASAGWPDALAGGPFCARLAAVRTSAPERVRRDASSVGGVPPAHDAVPILLVPTGAAAPDERVRAGLSAVGFTSSSPGFAVVLGGERVIPSSLVADVGALVGGAANTPPAPTVRRTFGTALDLSIVFAQPGVEGARICQERSTVDEVRWLALYGDLARTTFLVERDLHRDRLAMLGSNDPFCVPLGPAAPPSGEVTVSGVATGGTTAVPVTVSLEDATALSGPIVQQGRPGSGGTRYEAAGLPQSFVELRAADTATPVTFATLDLQLNLTATTVPVTGIATVRGLVREVTATIRAEARNVLGTWEIRGRADLGLQPDGSTLAGGFTATIRPVDDLVEIEWRLDAFPTASG